MDAFDQFARKVERCAELTGTDIVALAEETSLSLAQASTALDVMVVGGKLERVFVDASGRTLHPDEVAETAHHWALGGRGLRVVWRRCRPQAYLIA